MNSAGNQGRTRRRARRRRAHHTRAVLRFPIAMLLVMLALPLGTIGTASAEDATSDPAAPSEATSQAAADQATSETGTTEPAGDVEPSDGQSAPAGEPTQEPAAESTTDAAGPSGSAGSPGSFGSSEPTAPTDEADATVQVTAPEAEATGPEPLALVAPVSQTGGFEIDGDVAVNNGGKDWESSGTKVVDGANDSTVYTDGSELSDPREWQDASSATAPGNDDIVTAYSHTEMVGGVLWVFFGFERATTSGTSNYVIEYNRLANWSNDPAQPRRSPGDLRLRVTQGGSGTFSVAGVERWSLTPGPGCQAVASRDKTVIGYWCPAPDATPYFKGVSSDDKAFAEGALNLSGLLGGGDNCLGGYGVVNMRSFSGGSESSQLKDYVAGTPVTVPSTCGSLDILKVDQFGDPVPGATFTVAPNPAPGGASGTLTVTDGGAGDPDGTRDGTVSIDPARPGDYTVTETGVPTGYLPPDVDSQQAVVPQNGSDTVTFVNDRAFEPLTATNEATATYDVTYDWRIRKTADSRHLETPEGTPVEPEYTVTLEALDEQRDGYEVEGILSITNPNQRSVIATVDAGLTGDIACSFGAADASSADEHQVEVGTGTHRFAYTCELSGTPGATGTSTATVAWDAELYPPVPGTNPGNPAAATDDYAFEVDSVTDEQVTVSDTFGSETAEELGTFTWSEVRASTEPAAHTVVVPTRPHTIDGVPGTCTSYDNTATAVANDSAEERTDTATVEVCVGRDLDVDKTVGVSYTRAYGWDLAKSGPATVFVGDDGQGAASYDITVTATQPMDTGVSVSGTITVTNPNDWDMVADVTDRFSLRGVAYPCLVEGGDDVLVLGDGTAVLSYTCDLSSLPGDVWPDGYAGANEVTVTWDQSGYFTPGDDVVFTNHVDPPEVSETPAFATITLADAIAAAGGSPEAVDLGAAGGLGWADVWAEDGHRVTFPVPVELDTSLAADECTTYTNVVSVPGSPIEPADADTEVCRPAIAKTVDAGFERTYGWTVDKSVDETEVEIAEDGSATFTYTVGVAPAGFEDGGASLSGVITVTNPSGSTGLAAQVADVADVAGWTCEVSAEDADVTVPPGESVDVAYTCTPPDSGEHPSGDNTATATFGDSVISVTEQVDFDEAISIDETIEVTDPKAPDGVAGSFDWADGAQQVSYTWTTSGVPGQCTTYDNTATVTSTGQTASESVQVCVEAPLEVAKTATGSFDRDYDWSLDKVAVDDAASVPEGEDHRFPYRVTATPDGYTDSGFEAHGTITVTNPNEYAAGGISATVSDELSGITGARCTVTDPAVDLAPGATVTLDYDCTLAPTAADYVGENVATAVWTPAPLHVPAQAGDPTTASVDSEPVAVSLALDQHTDFTVEVVDDPQGAVGPDVLGTARWGAEPGTATAGESTVFEYDGPLRAGAPGACTPYTNTASIDQAVGEDLDATAEVELCVGRDLAVTKSVGVAYDRTYHWSLAKTGPDNVFVGDDSAGEATYDITVTAEPPTDSGVLVTGTIRVHNDNAWPMVADVADTFTLRGVETPCTVPGGQDVTVPANGSVALDYSCELDAATWPDGYDGSNQVTVTWDAEEYATSGGSASDTNVVDEPEVTETPAFETITLRDRITQEGLAPAEVTLPADVEQLAWDDVRAEDGHQVSFPVTVALEPALEPAQCTTYTNVVSVPGSAVTPADASTEVCRPGIEKSVDATYERVHEWTIDKVADETDVVVGTDGTRTFTYTVTVAPDGFHDAEQSLSGVITVTNPSATTDLDVDVSDLSGVEGWTCVTDAAGVTVPPGGSVPVDYTCAPLASGAHPAGTNTATASFGDATVSVTEDVRFAQVASTDATIEVIDPKAPGGVLGTADWADGEAQFTYAWTSPVGDPGTCAAYDNTATITSTGQTASETVRVCTEAPLDVASTATATMERDHEWTIEKEASRRHVQLLDADPPASVDYTVTVTPGDRIDSGWALSGMTTVVNANDFTDLVVELDQLTDVGEDVVCEYTDGATLTVPADGSVEAPFTCSLDGTSYTDGTLTTQASWGDGDAGTATTQVVFEVVSETGAVVTVHDDLADPEGEGRVLGTVEWNAEGTATELTYTSTHDAPADEPCPVYTNTAQVVETGQEAQASVEVCRTRTGGAQNDPDPGDSDDPTVTPVVSTAPKSGLPNTGAPAGMLQLGALGVLATMLGLVLLWQSRRLRRQE